MLHGNKLLIVHGQYIIVNFRIFVASCAVVWYMVTALRMCTTLLIVTKLMVPAPFTACVCGGGGVSASHSPFAQHHAWEMVCYC